MPIKVKIEQITPSYRCPSSFFYRIANAGQTAVLVDYDVINSWGNMEFTVTASTTNANNEVFVGLTEGYGEVFQFGAGITNQTKTVGLYSPQRFTQLIINVYSDNSGGVFTPFDIYFSGSCPTVLECPIVSPSQTPTQTPTKTPTQTPTPTITPTKASLCSNCRTYYITNIVRGGKTFDFSYWDCSTGKLTSISLVNIQFGFVLCNCNTLGTPFATNGSATFTNKGPCPYVCSNCRTYRITNIPETGAWVNTFKCNGIQTDLFFTSSQNNSTFCNCNDFAPPSLYEAGATLTDIGGNCVEPTPTPTPTPTKTPVTPTPTPTPTQTSITPTPTQSSITPTPTRTPTMTPSSDPCSDCPSDGFTKYNSESCYKFTTTPHTNPIKTLGLSARGAGVYSDYGSRWFATGFNFNGTGTIQATLKTANAGGNYSGTLWANPNSNSFQGPLNRTALWNSNGSDKPLNTWVGFSVCLEGLITNKTYWIGVGADDQYRFVFDGIEIINSYYSYGSSLQFRWWNIYPIQVGAGQHTLEVYGLNQGGPGGFGFEIYDNTIEQLTGFTNYNQLNIVFTTANKTIAQVVENFNGNYTTSGFSCPAGYVYSNCILYTFNKCIKYNFCQPSTQKFCSVPGFDLTVNKVQITPDGNFLYVGGFFDNYNGSPAPRLAKLDQSGNSVSSFNISTGMTDLNDRPYDIAVQSDGKIVVVGIFTKFTGTTYNNIIRLHPNGHVDSSFNIGSGFNGGAFTVKIQSDGKIIVGGQFTQYNGSSCSGIVRLNSNGTVDTTFNMGVGFSRVGGYMSVWSISIQSDGKILCGGGFTSYRGQNANNVCRINSDGTFDYSFEVGTGLSAVTVNPVTVIKQLSSGKIIIGGYAFREYQGIPVTGAFMVRSDGFYDSTFSTSSWGINENAGPYDVIETSKYKLLFVGNFYFQTGGYFGILMTNPDGTYYPYFDPGGGFDDIPFSVLEQPNGQFVVGGGFTDYDNVQAGRIVMINSDGSGVRCG